MSSDSGPLWGQIILLVVLIAVNAYFAAAEMAIISVNKNKMRSLAQEGNKKAEALSKLMDEPNKFLSAIQVIITLAGFLASAEAAISLSDDMGGLLESIKIPYSDEVSVVVVTLILSFFTLVLGELFPKRLAMLHADGIALAVVKPILFISALFKPFVWFLSVTVTGLLKICRQRTDVTSVEYSEDDVVSMLEAGQESGELKEEGKKMITSIFAFDDMLAYEVMTPRTDVFSIDINAPTEEYIDELMELRYSRIPVYEDDSDNIIGVLYIKDYLIKAREDGFENVDISSILRKPYLVPETKNIDSLFFELQTTKQHIAILIDEYGGFSGIVTMEDIIEEVMGDIDDEYDEDEPEIEKIAENIYVVDGGMDLDDIDEELDIDLQSDNSETIGGFIIDILGEIPDENDIGKEVEFENYRFRIDSIKDRRIENITMTILPVEQEEKDGEETDGEHNE
ncbi:MAG: HlyC/CorC family transporter [Clostridiales bacterium]|nr:HlyC/CorC family transporter [Clostridiales bacterium]